MNNASPSLPSFRRQYYLWQTPASDCPPRGQVGEVLHFLSFDKHDLFLETLQRNPPSWGSKFFFLNLSSFNRPPPSLRARANPQTQLMKLLWLRRSRKILDKNNLGEQKRAWWSNASSYSGARVEPGCRGTESFTSCPFVVFHHRLQLYCAAPFPSEPQKEKPCMNIKKKSMIHPVSAARLITPFAWRGDVEMSHHQSVVFFLKTRTWFKICSFSPRVSCWLASEAGRLLSASFPLHRYYGSLYAPSDIINSWEFVYSAHLNIAVNKLVSVMLKFVALHG